MKRPAKTKTLRLTPAVAAALRKLKGKHPKPARTYKYNPHIEAL